MKSPKNLSGGAGTLMLGLLIFAVTLTQPDRLSAQESLSTTDVAKVGFDVQQLVADPANLVFSEDFSDAASIDRFTFSSASNWKRVRVGDRFALEHTDGQAGYEPPYRSPLNIALVRARHFESFVLDYEAQQTGREYGHRDACVFFNFVGPANYYYTHIATKQDDHAHQTFIVNDAPRTKITDHGTSGFDWGPSDSWHRIRVIRDASSGVIQVFADDMKSPIMESRDTTHGWGAIGFGSFDDTGRVTNIRIYAADSKPADVHF